MTPHYLRLLDLVSFPQEGTGIVYQVVGQHKVLTIWVDEEANRRTLDAIRQQSGGRRSTIDALIELCGELGGISSIEMVSAHEGVCVFDITTTAGHTVEVTAADAARIAQHFDLDIAVSVDIINRVAVYVSPADLREYLGVEYITPVADAPEAALDGEADAASASGDPLADADFEAMMRSLGMDDADFRDGGNGTDNK